MRFTDEQVQKIAAVLMERLVHARTCLFCGGGQFDLAKEIVLVNVHPANPLRMAPDGFFPSVAITCTTCGNIQTYNVHVLGVAELLGIPPPEKPPKNG